MITPMAPAALRTVQFSSHKHFIYQATNLLVGILILFHVKLNICLKCTTDTILDCIANITINANNATRVVNSLRLNRTLLCDGFEA